ncbi:MAG: FAD-dependent monooxygenase [Alphaproteobacteria bacterium]|nr:FAD-dependent monooxygenase [Alphaproteobacteria bacterium]
MAPRLDIGVAGCGLAGLGAALLLTRAGHRVTLYDRLPVPAPIGSGLLLQPTGLAVLERLGLARQAVARGAVVTRLFGRSVPSGRAVLDVRYGAGSFAIGIHRAALFDLLYTEVQRLGIALEAATEITDIDPQADGRARLVAAGGRRLPGFDLVVDALGVRSPLAGPPPRPLEYGALWASLAWPEGAGFAPDTLEQRYRRAERMAGVLPIGRLGADKPPLAAVFWSLRGADAPQVRERGLPALLQEIRSLWPQTEPFLAGITAFDQLALARYAHRTRPPPWRRGLVPIGDAAHAASPQLGQGANMALLDAFGLAEALDHAPDAGSALSLYWRRRRLHVHLYQALAAVLTPLYQSDGSLAPALRDHLAAPLFRIRMLQPLFAGLVAGLAGWPLRPLGLAPPGRELTTESPQPDQSLA